VEQRPLDELPILAIQEVDIGDHLSHIEVYTFGGLLSFLWHGDPAAEAVVVTCGGAMGGLLGPADAIYHALGRELAAEGVGVLRVGYRRPNDLDACILDVAAAVDVASRRGGRRFVVMGHSFGGAVAVGVASMLPDDVRGVVTFATQSAGCEGAGRLGGRPLLLFHGEADELLPAACSETVRAVAGAGEVVVLPGAGHLLTGAAPTIMEKLRPWLRTALAVTGSDGDGTVSH
jgi:alpha-beta hydrolase superfamily lysophospholipase